MSPLRLLAATAAAAAALAGCAPRVVVVRTAGWAAEDAARPGTASRRATTDALRRAVEKASGVRIAARTRVRDGAGVSERVTAEAEGCVLGYSVLADRAEAGGRSVLLKARVARAASDCGAPPPGLGARVAVVFGGSGTLARAAGREAAAVVGAELARRGWSVVNGPAALTVTIDAEATDVAEERLAPLQGARVDLDVRVEAAGALLKRLSTSAAAVEPDAASAASRASRRAAAAASGPAAEALTGGFWAAASDD
jgi:hypothetical protein